MEKKCSRCGVCCRLFYVNLSEEEYRSGRYQTQFPKSDLTENWREVVAVGANLLARNADGRCVYLKNNRCSIHETRPRVCRDFFCDSTEKRFQGMIKQIRKAQDQLTSLKNGQKHPCPGAEKAL